MFEYCLRSSEAEQFLGKEKAASSTLAVGSDIVSPMDRKTLRELEYILVYDYLKEGMSPQYDIGGDDVWYLGLAGELASEIKCSNILLPMLDRKTYDWKEKLNKALEEAISLRPQRHVDTFAQAWDDLATHEKDYEVYSYTWFANEETRKRLQNQVEYDERGKYKKNHYYVDRCGLVLDLPPKTVAILPEPEWFGVLSINEKFFNFAFRPKQIQVYHLRNLKIGPDA